MKGLLIKDCLTFRGFFKHMLYYFILMVGFSIFFKTSLYIMVMLPVVSVSFAISVVAADEKTGWDRYALTLPMGRKGIVMERYLFSILIIFAIGIVSLVLGMLLVFCFGESRMDNLMLWFAAMLFIMFLINTLLPIVFKLGTEKARIYMVLFIMLLTLTFMGISRFMERYHISISDYTTQTLLILIGTIIVLLSMLVSYMVSYGIISKKEY